MLDEQIEMRLRADLVKPVNINYIKVIATALIMTLEYIKTAKRREKKSGN
jgi:hypothetical protein